jgi:ABC-type oligopeptide transport system ATPase subunit
VSAPAAIAPEAARDVVIDVHGLTKSFGGHVVVRDLSMQVRRGTIFGFLGPNGSGKTTTIRMLCGLLTPDQGSGTCLGFDIRTEAAKIKTRAAGHSASLQPTQLFSGKEKSLRDARGARRADHQSAARGQGHPHEAGLTMHAPSGRRPRIENFAREIVKNDPDFHIEGARGVFADTANPYFAWLAIEVCVKHEKEIPDWLRCYLLQCAERMQSDAAKKRGLREALPWVFDFSKKAGPGNLLDPYRDSWERSMLAIRFAIKLERGEKPSAALKNACIETFDPKRADKIKEKTLRSWLCTEFDLKKWPRTNAEWRAIARKHYISLDTFFVDYARRIFGK